MKRFPILILAVCLMTAGCAKESDDSTGNASSNPASATGGGRGPGSAPQADDSPPQPVSIEAGKVILTPENTRVEFVGTHAGGDPNPRTGGFKTFTGTAETGEDEVTLAVSNLKCNRGSPTGPRKLG